MVMIHLNIEKRIGGDPMNNKKVASIIAGILAGVMVLSLMLSLLASALH